MKGYCNSCKKEVEGIKPKINWLIVFFCLITFIGIVPYMILRLIRPANRCPICRLKIE